MFLNIVRCLSSLILNFFIVQASIIWNLLSLSIFLSFFLFWCIFNLSFYIWCRTTLYIWILMFIFLSSLKLIHYLIIFSRFLIFKTYINNPSLDIILIIANTLIFISLYIFPLLLFNVVCFIDTLKLIFLNLFNWTHILFYLLFLLVVWIFFLIVVFLLNSLELLLFSLDVLAFIIYFTINMF